MGSNVNLAVGGGGLISQQGVFGAGESTPTQGGGNKAINLILGGANVTISEESPFGKLLADLQGKGAVGKPIGDVLSMIQQAQYDSIKAIVDNLCLTPEEQLKLEQQIKELAEKEELVAEQNKEQLEETLDLAAIAKLVVQNLLDDISINRQNLV